MQRVLILAFAAAVCAAQWMQFGGPRGDFSVAGDGLAAAWPASGPKRLWKRALGEGYSAIAVDGAVLYTMYRRGEQEVVAALDAATGATKWEFPYDASSSGMALENGPGPHSTPLISGDRIYTIGIRARMHAFDKRSGKPVWIKDLWKDFPGSTYSDRGYSVSPIAYKDTVLVKLGGPNHAMVALRMKDGSLAWEKYGFQNAPATPVIYKKDGGDVLITQFADEVVGLNPDNGDLKWQHPHKTRYGLNIAPPLWGTDNIVVVTSAYDGGARGIQIESSGARELWHTNRFRVHFTNAVRIGGHVYGSSGDFGPAPLSCVEVKTGKVVWQDRTFAKANLLLAGSRVVLLDEDGTLGLVTLSPTGLKVHSKVTVAANNAWTAPSLVGGVLYVRDRRDAMAFDLR